MDHVETCLHRTVLWGCLARAFRRPDASPFTLAEDLPAAARALGLDAEDFAEASAGARDLRDAHDRLFGHTVRGPCPAYEGEYGEPKGLRYAHEIGDVGGFFRAFGLKPSSDHRERPDHVAVECEFMAFLALKEACARELHGEEKAGICRDAAHRFLGQHLGRFGRAFAHRVQRHTDEPFYLAAARLLDRAIRSDAERLGAQVGPEDLPLREDAGTPDDACVACGKFPGTPR